MEELLRQLLGKKIDVTCGTNAAFRGDVVDVKSGVLYLRDEEDKVAYVAVDKIAVIYECKDPAIASGVPWLGNLLLKHKKPEVLEQTRAFKLLIFRSIFLPAVASGTSFLKPTIRFSQYPLNGEYVMPLLDEA